jgi:hypothetical protein
LQLSNNGMTVGYTWHGTMSFFTSEKTPTTYDIMTFCCDGKPDVEIQLRTKCKTQFAAFQENV